MAHRSGGRGLLHDYLGCDRQGTRCGQRRAYSRHERVAVHALRQRCPEVEDRARGGRLGDARLQALGACTRHRRRACSCRHEHPDLHGQRRSRAAFRAHARFRPCPRSSARRRRLRDLRRGRHILRARRGRCIACLRRRRSSVVQQPLAGPKVVHRARLRGLLHDHLDGLGARARRFQWRAHPWHERVAMHAVWQQHAEVAPRRQRQRLLLAYLEGQRARARYRRRNLRRWHGRAHVDSERGHRPIVRLQPVRAHVRRRHLRACAFERQGYRPRCVRRIDRIGRQRAGSHGQWRLCAEVARDDPRRRLLHDRVAVFGQGARHRGRKRRCGR